MVPHLAKMESRDILNFREEEAPGTVGRNLPKRHRLKETEGVFFEGKESCWSRHRLERGQGRRAEGARKRPRIPASERGPRAAVARGDRRRGDHGRRAGRRYRAEGFFVAQNQG